MSVSDPFQVEHRAAELLRKERIEGSDVVAVLEMSTFTRNYNRKNVRRNDHEADYVHSDTLGLTRLPSGKLKIADKTFK